MEEIFRYQQLRQTQKLSEEQKLSVGLPLYPDKNLSDLANKLIKASNDSNSYASDMARYTKGNNDGGLTDVSQLRPTIRLLYDWLNFKARPIKKDEFKKFINSLPNDPAFDLKKEW